MDNFLGQHILAEFWDCDKDKLNDVDVVSSILLQAAKEAKTTIVETCFHKFSPYGVSGVVVISESHLAIHTWPEHNYAAVDFFTCSKHCNPQIAIDSIKQAFSSKKVEIKTILRGVL